MIHWIHFKNYVYVKLNGFQIAKCVIRQSATCGTRLFLNHLIGVEWCCRVRTFTLTGSFSEQQLLVISPTVCAVRCCVPVWTQLELPCGASLNMFWDGVTQLCCAARYNGWFVLNSTEHCILMHDFKPLAHVSFTTHYILVWVTESHPSYRARVRDYVPCQVRVEAEEMVFMEQSM